MALRNAVPIAFRPSGITDALDASTSFDGAMALLQNLIPDPSTKNLWQCRPAAQKVLDFTTQGGAFNPQQFSNAFAIGFSPGSIGAISVLLVLGNYAYGMIATGRNPGHDEPFAYNLVTNTLTVVSGVTNANTPVSPATAGDWVPPQLALIGAKLILTHPGYSGAGGVYFGVMDISNPAAPAWSGGNLTGAIVFTTPPSFVAQFNGRAWYIVNPPVGQPSVVFSDILAATTVTNANQALTFGDSLPLTALAGLPLNAQQGGIIQALLVFKGVANIYQITGDAAALPTSTLAVNALNIAVGTLAPNTLTSTPLGLAFVAPDGLRIIDFFARVGDPIGHDGQGKTLPFFFALSPSRMNAAANGNVMRIQVQDGSVAGNPFVEYWYDFVRKTWSGPHTGGAMPSAMIARYLNTFITAPVGVPATLWRSDAVQSATSTYVENGQQLTFNWQTSYFPDTDQMSENAMVESTLYMAFAAGQPAYNINALDHNNAVLSSTALQFTGAASLWGSMTWGQSLWGGASSPLAPHALKWPAPIEFRRMKLQLTGQSAGGVKVGALHMRYQKLGYLQEGITP